MSCIQNVIENPAINETKKHLAIRTICKEIQKQYMQLEDIIAAAYDSGYKDGQIDSTIEQIVEIMGMTQ